METQKTFEEAIRVYLLHEEDCPELAYIIDAIHKEECIRFAEFASWHKFDRERGFKWMVEEKWISTDQLFDLFNEDKTIKL